MTATARKVLADCRVAHQMLEDEVGGQQWRVVWAGAVALLRTVGDVLDKVDSHNTKVRKITRAQFEAWKNAYDPDSPTRQDFFWAFIKNERDQPLHAYESDVFPKPIIRVVASCEQFEAPEAFDLDENLFRPLVDGPWAGEDARDVHLEAISWWEYRLNEIDLAAS